MQFQHSGGWAIFPYEPKDPLLYLRRGVLPDHGYIKFVAATRFFDIALIQRRNNPVTGFLENELPGLHQNRITAGA
jgi:hypothetical protein